MNPNALATLSDIIKNNSCNSIVMTNVFTIFHYLVDLININSCFRVVGMVDIKEIFCAFRQNGFDQVHEITIHLLKAIFTKKKANDFLKQNDHKELIIVSMNAFKLLKNKIKILGATKIGKSIFQIITMIFNIVNLLNNLNNKKYVYQTCIEMRILDYLSETLFSLMDSKYSMNVFQYIEKYFESKLDFSLINCKTIILRTLYYSITLITDINDFNPDSLV